MSRAVTDSQFYMWRTLFAISHADNVLTAEEIRYMTEILEEIPFSEGQKNTLRNDIANPQDIEAMFVKISDQNDRTEFFNFARELVWIDGDFGEDEQAIMVRLKQLHIMDIDVDKLVGNVQLQLEGDDDIGFGAAHAAPRKTYSKEKSMKDIVFSFREKFIKDKLGK